MGLSSLGLALSCISLFITVVSGLDVNADVSVDTTFLAASSPYIVSTTRYILGGATLTIEPGAILRFTTTSARIVVRGRLVAAGDATSTGRITFEGLGVAQSALLADATSSFVSVAFSTFTGFAGAAVTFACCDDGSIATFSHSLFTLNLGAPTGGYNRFGMLFSFCEFSYNGAPAGSSNLRFEDCYFHDSPAGADLSGQYVRSVFVGHSNYAVSSSNGGGSIVEDCLFVNNAIALKVGDSVSMKGTIILGGGVGISGASRGLQISGGSICGQTQYFITVPYYSSDASPPVADGVWFGASVASPAGLALVRGFIQDAYFSTTSPLIRLVNPVTSAPTWPTSLQGFSSTYGILCTAPTDRGFDLSRPPSGMVFSDVVWAAGAHEISSALVVATGATLTIEPGAILRFTTTSARIVVRGRLVAAGDATSTGRITFEGLGVAQSALLADATSSFVSVAFSTFTGFAGAAVTFACCDDGSIATFSHSLFTLNLGAPTGGYNRFGMLFSFCEFSYNGAPAGSSNLRFEDCYFHDSPAGADLSGQYVRSVFVGHSNYAVSSSNGGGSIVEDCLFVNNAIALKVGDSVSMTGTIILGGGVGVGGSIRSPPNVKESIICDMPVAFDFRSLSLDVTMSRIWLGSSSTFVSLQYILVRGGLRVILSNLLPRPPSLQQPILSAMSVWNISLPPFPCLISPCDPVRTCNGRGICLGTGECKCMFGWSGADCGTCNGGSFTNSTSLPFQCLPPCTSLSDCESCASRSDCAMCEATRSCIHLADAGSCNSTLLPACSAATALPTFNLIASMVDDARKILIIANSPTDMAGMLAGQVGSSCLLVFELSTVQNLGLGSSCYFLSPLKLQIALGLSYSIDFFSLGLQFRSNMLHRISDGYSVPGTAVSVQFPPRLPVPRASLVAPSTQSTCFPLRADASASLDTLGPLHIYWSCDSCSRDLRAAIGVTSTMLLEIPSSALVPSTIIPLCAELTNLWGVTSVVRLNISIVHGEILEVTLSQQGHRVILGLDPVPLSASAVLRLCDGTTAPIAIEDIDFLWVLGTLSSDILSQSSEPAYVIDPWELAPHLLGGKQLNLSVTVRVKDYGIAVASVLVQGADVLTMPMWLQVTPMALTMAMNRTALIAAVVRPKRLFLSDPGISMTCTWQCFLQGDVYFSATCGATADRIFAAHNLSTQPVCPRDLQLEPGVPYRISVSCSLSSPNSRTNRILSSQIQMYTVGETFPTSAFLLLDGIIVKNEDLGRTAVSPSFPVTFSFVAGEYAVSSLQCLWIAHTFDPRLGSWIPFEENGAIGGSGDCVMATFAQNTLRPSAEHRLSLTVFSPNGIIDPNTTSSTSTAFFSTSSVFGSLSLFVLPAVGEAFSTRFRVSIPAMSASAVPDGLNYRFGYTINNVTFVSGGGARGFLPLIYLLLPPGNVLVWVEVSDVSGDRILANTTVTVFSSSSPLTTLQLQSTLARYSSDPEMLESLLLAYTCAAMTAPSVLSQASTLNLLKQLADIIQQQPSSMLVFDVLQSRLEFLTQLLPTVLAQSSTEDSAIMTTTTQAVASAFSGASASNSSIGLAAVAAGIRAFSALTAAGIHSPHDSGPAHDMIDTAGASALQLGAALSWALETEDSDVLLRNFGILPSPVSLFGNSTAPRVPSLVTISSLGSLVSLALFQLGTTASLVSAAGINISVVENFTTNAVSNFSVLQIWQKSPFYSTGFVSLSPVVVTSENASITFSSSSATPENQARRLRAKSDVVLCASRTRTSADWLVGSCVTISSNSSLTVSCQCVGVGNVVTLVRAAAMTPSSLPDPTPKSLSIKLSIGLSCLAFLLISLGLIFAYRNVRRRETVAPKPQSRSIAIATAGKDLAI